ncbi:MAG TPA: UbiA-like polyprenyltransferase [Candidatus Saccharimonadales bacterium]|nr:UbiA-like polyprenyltransferase [Candidatus Saccharimonadales bacterium]
MFQSILHKLRVALEMIKWEHSFLTLPFGLTGAVIAANGIPSLRTLGWICVAMIAARSAAMAFNRLVDADIDALNPRTSIRAIPAGLLTPGFVLGFTIATSALLFFAAWMLNPLAFYLSPVALIIVCSYSYTKRFTRWAHLFLGFAMGIAPAAAWVAVRGTLDPRVLIVTAAVMFWGGGFDILYSCQDYKYDIASGLHSIPSAFGIAGALRLARVFHLVAFVFFAWMLFSFGLGHLAIAGVAITGLALLYEHTLVSANDLSKLNAAFFTTNGFISMLILFAVTADRILQSHRG